MPIARRAVKSLALLSALVAAPLAAQQQGVATEPAPAPAAATAATPKPSALYESNTPAPGTIKEAQEANSAADGSKKHTLVLSTIAIVVIAVVLIFVL